MGELYLIKLLQKKKIIANIMTFFPLNTSDASSKNQSWDVL